MVFCPSNLNGLIEFNKYKCFSRASWVIASKASSKLPLIENTSAPWNIACANLPRATLPAGKNTAHLNPALAAYAAREAEVLPVEAQPTVSTPSIIALVIPMVIPLSLKLPVGFDPSTLT